MRFKEKVKAVSIDKINRMKGLLNIKSSEKSFLNFNKSYLNIKKAPKQITGLCKFVHLNII